MDQRGFALVGTVMILVLLALLTPAVVFTGGQSALAARAGLEALRARMAAASAVQAALAGWSTSQIVAGGAAPPLLVDEFLAPGLRMRAGVEAVGTGLFLVRGEGTVLRENAVEARALAGYLVLAPDPRPLAAAQDAGLVAVEAGDGGVPPWSWSRLAAAADATVQGSITPGPTVDGSGACAASLANWGAPDDPGHPCASRLPLLYAPGDLTLEGGVGQGILVVEGALVLQDGARFHGLVLVRGALLIGEGAELRGGIRLEAPPGGAVVDGALHHDPELLEAVVRRSPALNRPYRGTVRAWIPLF